MNFYSKPNGNVRQRGITCRCQIVPLRERTDEPNHKFKDFYIVYKTTNTITNEFYIGCHSCMQDDCKYLGSGYRLLDNIKTHKPNSFVRENLFVFDNIVDCYKKESELVTEDTIKDPLCLNMVSGGSIPTNAREFYNLA